MIVGKDISVAAQDKPGAAGRGLNRLAENVDASLRGGVDGHDAVYRCGIDRGIAYGLSAGGGIQHHGGDRSALRDNEGAAPGHTPYGSAAQQAAAQHERNPFPKKWMPFLRAGTICV